MSKAGTLAKLLIGVIIFLAGIYWYIGTRVGEFLGLTFPAVPFFPNALASLKVIFEGLFRLVLILFGALLAWLEFDEWKTQKQMSKKGRKK